MVNDNSKKVKPWKILLGILLLFLITLYLNDQLENDQGSYPLVKYPPQGVDDLNNQFNIYQDQHRKMVEANDRNFERWHQNFMEN